MNPIPTQEANSNPAPLPFSALSAMSPSELDELFKRSPAGPIPEGEAKGTAIVWPGTFWTRWIARLVRGLAWQGKVFTRHPDGSATLVNRVSAARIPAIVARVYYAESWLDGKQVIVLDYSKTSLLARKIRDEIRLVDESGKLYLGKVWWGKKRLIDFALDFP
jgi:hypothetical protein